MKAPIPNMDQILKSNPDIARQLSMAAMQQQVQGMKAPPPPPVQATYAAPSNPLAGLSSFMSGMIPPPPQQTNVRPQQPPKNMGFKPTKPNLQPPAAAVLPSSREMKGPVNIDDLLKSVNANVETKSVKMTPPPSTPKKGGSTGKNSVTIKL